MDFLKSTLANAISKGPPFPYTFHDRVDLSSSTSIWTLYNGTQQSTSKPCSVFTFEVNDATRSKLPLAKNALRKWRTLRHPGVVKVLDSVETDSYIYIASERVSPLDWHLRRGALAPETIKWGLWSLTITLKFVNGDAASIHGAVRTSSVFVSSSGEWKLAGFEVLSSVRDDEPFIYRYGGLLPDSARYAAPEISKGGYDGLRSLPIHATDSWGFGILIHEAFNGPLPSTDALTQPKKIPAPLQASYKRLVSANPKTRLSVAHFLEQGLRSRSFFDTPLVHISSFVENMGVKSEEEREEFLEELERTGDQFPEDFFKAKILPELLKSVEFGGGGPKVFSAVLKIGEKLSDEEWEESITPAVVRLFSLPDRATRVFLLDNLDKMISHLSNKVVNDKIFPEMITGFSDSAPIVREQTIKAVLVVVPKLSDRNTNGELLKQLAKTQNDEQPGIRTNTTICLGKIARHLGANTRQKVLIAAFTRSLRDPFVHARNAALLALAATTELFSEVDSATKVLPAIAPSLVDKDKSVRTQAHKSFDMYLARIKSLTASYPDVDASAVSPAAGTVSAVAAGVGADGWAGWAISSFTKKLTSTAVEGEMSAKSPGPSQSPAPQRPVVTLRPTQSAPSTTAKAATSGLAPQSGGDDFEAWDEDADEEEEESFFDAPARQPRRVEKKAENVAVPVKGAPVSSFGPKPFNPNVKKVPAEKKEEKMLQRLAKPKPKGLAGVKKVETKRATTDDDGDGWDDWD